jgi:cell division protein FtsL
MALFAVLVGLVVVSGVALVSARQQARELDLAIREQQRQIRELETEWGRLQLELASITARSRVERLARERLGMEEPSSDQVWEFRW